MENNSYIHPSKDILESKGTILRGKTICMCLTGSVAVISAPIIARELMRLGADVISVMTKAAKKLITPALMHWATGNPVITKLTGAVEHIYLAGERPKLLGRADLILVCPATANTISKIASGIDDTPVTTVVTTAFGSSTPIIIVPAMHESMFRHPILAENQKKLKKHGVEILDPRISEGKAKIARIDDIIDRVIDLLVSQKDCSGLNFIVTSGPSREWLDGVRFISNSSSGRQGIEIAKEIKARGGNVLLINGTSKVKAPGYINTINVETTNEFLREIEKALKDSDVKYQFLISAAALSDYKFKEEECRQNEKINSDEIKHMNVELELTPKIIDNARKVSKSLVLIPFKAEISVSKSQLIDRAYERLIKSDADLIVANDLTKAVDRKTNEIYIIDKEKHITHVPEKTKRYIASRIIDKALEIYRIKIS